MKKTNFLMSLFTATMLLWGVGASAQVSVANFAQFDAAYQEMQDVGGTITLTANVTFTTDYDLEPTAPVTIDVAAYKLYVNTAGLTLTIGNNVTIIGSNRLVDINKVSTVVVNGATMESTGNGAVVYLNAGGIAEINGGTFTGAGGGNSRLLELQNVACSATVNGGTFTVGDGGRCIYSYGTVNINGATLNLNPGETGNGTTAIYCAGSAGEINILDDVDIVNLNPEGACTGIQLANGVLITVANGVTFTNEATRLTAGGGAATAWFDYNNAASSISVDPADGTMFPNANGIVTISIDDIIDYAFPVGFRYTTDGSDPTSTNSKLVSSTTSIAATEQVQITDSEVVIKVRVARGAHFWDNTVYTYTYYAEGLDPANPIITVRDFSELVAAYEASQAAGIESTTIIIGAAFSITSQFDFSPVKPVTVEQRNSITTGNNTTFGGALTINIEDNPLMIGGNTAFEDGLVINGTMSNANIRTSGSPTLTINGGDLTAAGSGNLIQLTSANAKVIVNGGSLNANGAATLIQLSNATASVETNGGTFTVLGTGTNAKAFQVSSGGGRITINNADITIGGGGRLIHLSAAGTVKIYDGTFAMNGTNTASQIIRIDNGGTNSVEIDGGTFNLGRGNLITFGGNQNSGTCVVRAADVDLAGGILYVKNGPGDGTERPTNPGTFYGIQKIYDFRGFIITPSVAPGPIVEPVTVALSLPAMIDPDPVDAEGAAIYYGLQPVAMSSIPVLSLYSAPISISPETKLYVVVRKSGFESNMTSFIYGKSTGIKSSSIDEAKAYIADNTLFLSNAGAVRIYSVSGQLVLNAFGATVDVSSLNKGIYIVKAGTATFKVVK